MQKYYGNYRGLVVDNQDVYIIADDTNSTKKPLKFSRCKIYVEGIYPPEYKDRPDLLPWAEAVMPLFGGNGASAPQAESDKADGINRTCTNASTGVITTPHIGAWVWVFFEAGNIMYPQYFGAIQAGTNYFAEHENQHIIKTDNIMITIDENPEHPDSTSYTDSNNSNCTSSSKMAGLQKKNMPTLLNVVITTTEKNNNSPCALNLTINGNVNMKLNGNQYKEINGDVFITHNGNLYYKHDGHTEYEQTGDTAKSIIGNEVVKISKDPKRDSTGNYSIATEGGSMTKTLGNQTIEIGGDQITLGHATIQRSGNIISDMATQIIKHN